jgi:hypothetical protein
MICRPPADDRHSRGRPHPTITAHRQRPNIPSLDCLDLPSMCREGMVIRVIGYLAAEVTR